MDMKCYYGEVHAHTTESDGSGPPEQAYAHARDVGHADYFAATDHNLGRYNAERVAYVGRVAEEANRPGEFAALYGYEMTYETSTGHYGHANILQPKGFFTTDLTLDEWYDGMAKIGETGIGQFNHPGEKWGNFNEFAFDARMDDIFRLIELRITEYGIPCIEAEYDRALRMGWHISPVSNEDTHSPTWTTTREETGAVLAEELTRESILEAMRQNRTYATTDKTFRLFYKANGEWIGSRLQKTGELKVEIEASTEKECGVGVLQLVGEHNRVLAQVDAGTAKSYRWEITVPDDQRYTYVKRIASMQYAISGAVWVEQSTPLSVDLHTSYQNGELVAVAKVKNDGEQTVTDLRVEWYPASGSIELNAKPFVSNLDDLQGKKTARAAFRSPVLPQYVRLVAVVKGVCGDREVNVSDVIYLSPLTIRRFFCNTYDFKISHYQQQEFCCYDLYNETDVEIDLSAYVFRYYLFGKYREYRIPRRLAPHKTLTVWMRGRDGSATLRDFNAFYGTELTEEQVYACPLRFEPTDHTRKITVGYGDEVCCRAWIRSDGYHAAEVANRDCFHYDWLQKSSTMQVLGLLRNAKPHGECIAIPEATALPDGVATACYTPAKQTAPRRLAVLSDGGVTPEALTQRARELFPKAEEILPVIGNNDGSKNLLTYFYNLRGWMLLDEIVALKPDAVLISMGANDCGKKRTAWLDHNFYGYPTVMIYALRALYARSMPLYLTMPALDEQQGVDRNVLNHQIRSVADTLLATVIGMPEEEIPRINVQDAVAERRIKKDAVRIAIVGDRFSEFNFTSKPYAFHLQELLGDGYDVRLYAAQSACVTKGAKTNYLTACKAHLKALKDFAPDVIVSWFGVADLRHAYADRWETFKPSFEQGYSDFLEAIAAENRRIVLITPFDRKIVDSRQTVNRQKGGMVELILGIAKEKGLETVDFFAATQKDPELIEHYRDMDVLSAAGVDRLAELVAEVVRK